MDQLHIANKVCGGCCAISLITVDTESSVSPIRINLRYQDIPKIDNTNGHGLSVFLVLVVSVMNCLLRF